MSKVKGAKSKVKQDGEIEIIDMGDGESSLKVSPLKNEIMGLIIIAFSILSLIFMVSDKTGGMGNIIKTFFLGLLGVGAYLMPFVLFTYGIVVIRNKRHKINKKRIFWFAMVVVSFISLDHIFYENFSGDTMWKYDLGRIYHHALKGDGGGLVGGIIAISLYKLFYVYGAIIVAITFFTIATMLAADVSILLGFGRIIKFFMKKREERLERRAKKMEATDVDDYFEKSKAAKNDPVISLSSEKVKNDGIININEYPLNDGKTTNMGNKESELEEIKIIDKSLENKINVINHISEDNMDEKVIDESNLSKGVEKNAYAQELEMAMNSEDTAQKSKRSKKSKEPVGQLDISYETGVSDAEAKKYVLPDIGMLNASERKNDANENKELLQNAKKLEETLESFGVNAKVLRVSKGPTVTRYELQPNHGVKVSRIVNLSDDIALNLAAPTVRIEAPIPGKSAVGIEIPNKEIQGVFLRDVVQTKEFVNSQSKLTFAVGMDVEGNPIISDIAKMPHMLIAGSTGSGKSVCVNTLIASVLYKASPEEVKVIMIDPKVVELNVYNGIPHLMIPVVTDPKKAAAALNWGVQEMLHRYNLFAESGTRDIKGYNSYVKDKAKLEGESEGEAVKELPQILIIIDELADLMMAAANEVEDAICRLAQMARAAGMHLVIATQRPSVDVITGVIKANIPSRIAFAVSSQVDSRTIIDMAGAEKLLGKGDMLFYPLGMSKPVRVQGPFISDKEVEKLVEFIKSQNNQVEYDEKVMDNIANMAVSSGSSSSNGGDADELLPQAMDIVMETQFASISMLQRRMRIGFSRAARLIDQMEARGIVGPAEGSKPRKVLMSRQDYEQMKMGEE